MSRANEVRVVQVDDRHEWLAAQIDELESRLVDALERLTHALELSNVRLQEVAEQAAKDRLAANWRTIGMMATVITGLVVALVTFRVNGGG